MQTPPSARTSRLLLAVANCGAFLLSVHGTAAAQPPLSGHGPFRSGAFGFMVALPPQFEYLIAPRDSAADGFRARLPTDGAVWITGVHTDSTTLEGVAAFIRAYRRRCHEMSASATTLGGLPATEFVFTCPGSNASVRTNHLLVALRPANGTRRIQYNLGLESPTPVDNATASAFDTLRRGFRTTPLP